MGSRSTSRRPSGSRRRSRDVSSVSRDTSIGSSRRQKPRRTAANGTPTSLATANYSRPTFPKCGTKTELETWRKEHKIRPKEVRLVEGPPVTRTVRFNASSPSQVIKGMRSLGWEPVVENESGSIKTSEVELYRSGLPAGRLIAAYRGFAKLRFHQAMALPYARRKALSDVPAPDGAIYVVTRHRSQADAKNGSWKNSNLRTRFNKMVKRAG